MLSISPRVRRNLGRELRSSTMAKIGIVLLIGVFTVALFAPFLAPHNPYTQDLGNNLQPPVGFEQTETETRFEDGEVVDVEIATSGTWEHPLGTDTHGRDILSRIIFGARTSLAVGLLGTGLAVLMGVSVGLTAGYYGGRVDDALMRGADVMLAFPSLILAIALIGLTGANRVFVPDPFVQFGLVEGMPTHFVLPGTVTLVVALVNWVWFARVARGEALSIRGEEYVKAARSVGASNARILRTHVLPNSVTPIIVLATIQVAAIILLESALSYLGFSGTTLSWGFDIAQGRDHLRSSPWVASIPGLAIVVSVVAINLIGDWFRDALDPSIEGEGGV